MNDGTDVGNALMITGASFFFLGIAALTYSLYAEDASATKPALLMVFASLSAIVLHVGLYLRPTRDKARGKCRKREKLLGLRWRQA